LKWNNTMNNIETKDAKSLHQNRNRMYKDSDLYRKSFIDPSTGIMDRIYVENRSCPVCGSSSCSEIFVKNGGIYVSCNECTMIFLNPVFKDKDLLNYYQNNNSNQALAHESESDFYRKIYSAGLNNIAAVKREGSILDIGCSSGFFLDIAQERKYLTHGIELNKAEIEIARTKGHSVWDIPFDRINIDNQFDIITLWDVFEHIKDGVNYLKELRSKLVSSGIVFLQIPNADSLAARIMRERCNMFDGLEHVNLYSLRTITRTANEAGFKVHSTFSIIDELQPVLNYLYYEDPYNGSFSARDDFNFIVPNLIHEKYMGYKLQVILELN
jgi:2-polyprenyl-3-methyl-5-hydroxy-6-metoxy-1,4-benzoquinol methylase